MTFKKLVLKAPMILMVWDLKMRVAPFLCTVQKHDS